MPALAIFSSASGNLVMYLHDTECAACSSRKRPRKTKN